MGDSSSSSSSGLEAAAAALRVAGDELARVDALSPSPRAPAGVGSFFEGFALRGIRVLTIHPGLLTCSFTVPPRLTERRSGCLAPGAVVSLVDELGSAAAIADGRHLKVSTDMSVSWGSAAAAGERLHITARVLGHKGAYSGTHVLITKAATGEMVADGRHSLFGKMKRPDTTTISKM